MSRKWGAAGVGDSVFTQSKSRDEPQDTAPSTQERWKRNQISILSGI